MTKSVAGNLRRRELARPILLGLLLIWPSTAHADTGLPMLVVVWPWAWMAFIPVCIVEALIAKRLLRLPLVQCAKLSLVANAWSTLVGIPLTWLLLLVVEIAGGIGLSRFQPKPGLVLTLFAPVAAPWLGPSIRSWHVYAAAAFLCIPFMLVSIQVERWSVAKHVPREDARRWALVANLATYVPMIVGLATTALADRLNAP